MTFQRMKVCDISKWNGDVNFEKLQEEGFEGVFIRAGDGYTEDPRFREFRQKARLAGLRVGFYWFFRPNLSWQAQAEKFLAVVAGDRGDFGLVIDLEVHGGILPRSRVLTMAQLFLQAVQGRIIYTSPGFWGSVGGLTASWALAYDLWLAQWPLDNLPEIDQVIGALTVDVLTGKANPVKLSPWPTAIWWQFSAKGKSEGNGSSYIDLNASVLSREQVLKYYNLSDGPTTPPEAPKTFEELSARFFALEKWLVEHHNYIIPR